MSEITFTQALNTAKQLQNHYRAFEKLAETLEAAVQADKAVKVARRELDGLKSETEQAQANLTDVKARHESWREAMVEEQGKTKAAHRDFLKDLKAKESDAQAAHDARLAAMEDEFKTRRASRTQELDGLKTEIKRAGNELASINREYEALKQKLGG